MCKNVADTHRYLKRIYGRSVACLHAIRESMPPYQLSCVYQFRFILVIGISAKSYISARPRPVAREGSDESPSGLIIIQKIIQADDIRGHERKIRSYIGY